MVDWVNGAVAAASTLYNMATNERYREEDRQFAREMTQYENQLAQQNFYAQAQYNSPAAQMSRLRAAGLNPNLIYGQMSNATPMQSVSAKSSSQGSQYMVDPMTVANVRLANAQAKSIEHETQRHDEKQPYEVRQLQSTIDNLNKDIDVKAAQISSMSVDDQLKFAQIADYEFSHVMQEKEYQLLADRTVAEINKINSEININRQTYDEMIKTASARALGYDLNNELVRKQIGLTEKQIQEADKNIQLLGFEVNSGSVENDQNIRAYENYQNRKGSRVVNDILYSIGRFTSSLKLRVGLR